MEEVLVEDFDFVLHEDGWSIELDIDDTLLFNAVLLYDGGNCAILIRNKKKAYILANIPADIRRGLMQQGNMLIIERKNSEVINAYKVAIQIVENIPAPDNYHENATAIYDVLQKNLNEETFSELVDDMFPLE